MRKISKPERNELGKKIYGIDEKDSGEIEPGTSKKNAP